MWWGKRARASISLRVFEEIRIEIGAQAIGIAQGAFDALSHIRNSESSSGCGWANSKVSDTSWQRWPRNRDGRLIVYRAAMSIDEGVIEPMLTSMAKLYAAQVAGRSC